MPAYSCGREIEGNQVEKQPWWLRWSRKLEEEENGGSCCCCTTWWRKIRAHGGSDRFEQGEMELPAAVSFGLCPPTEREWDSCCMKETWEREWELLLLLPPAVRERAICEREESVKCVHTCMCAVLPATGERVKSKYWYCVPPVCLLGLLACETDRGGCWLIWSMEEQWMRWWCFASIFLSTDTEGKGEKDLRNKERKRQ